MSIISIRDYDSTWQIHYWQSNVNITGISSSSAMTNYNYANTNLSLYFGSTHPISP